MVRSLGRLPVLAPENHRWYSTSSLALDTSFGLQGVVVVKHTDCGSLAYGNERVRLMLGERAPRMKDLIGEVEFGGGWRWSTCRLSFILKTCRSLLPSC